MGMYGLLEYPTQGGPASYANKMLVAFVVDDQCISWKTLAPNFAET